jgi:hypothetical protein
MIGTDKPHFGSVHPKIGKLFKGSLEFTLRFRASLFFDGLRHKAQDPVVPLTIEQPASRRYVKPVFD